MQNKNWGNNKNQGYGNRRPNPARFNEFTVTKDGTGFTIPGTNYVFKFDRYGGWYDEDGNYYREDGQPGQPPRGRDDDYDQFGYDDEEDGYDPADDWVKEYEDGDDDDKDEYEQIDKVYLNVENRRLLGQYLKDDKVEVQLKNLDYRIRRDDLENFLKSKKVNLLKIEYGQNHRGQFNGVCSLSLYKQDAEQLLQLNGSKYNGRDLKVNVLAKEGGDDDDDIAVHEVGLGVNLNELEEEIKTMEKTVEKPVEKTEPLIPNLGTLEGKKVIDVATLESMQTQEAQKKSAPAVQQQQQHQQHQQQRQQQPQHHNYQNQQSSKQYQKEQNYQPQQQYNQERQQKQQHYQQYNAPVQKNESTEKGITAQTQQKVEEKAPAPKTIEESVSDTGKWANGGQLKKFAKKTETKKP